MSRFRKALTLFDDYYEMLSDDIRMQAFAAAIKRVVQPGDVVVDLGAGLGILGFLALKAGAARVYAIEKGDSIELAKAVAEKNGFSDKIVFLRQNSLECQLDEKADLLLSETLGSFSVDENTLLFTLDARKRFLKPSGKLLPTTLRLFVAPVDCPPAHVRTQFWREVGGIDYSPAMHEVLSRMSLADIDKTMLLAEPSLYADLDLATFDEVSLEKRMRFAFHRRGTLHGLCGWFEAHLCEGITLDTAPGTPKTHWRQAYFPFRESISVQPGDFLDVALHVTPKPDSEDGTHITYDYFCSQGAPELKTNEAEAATGSAGSVPKVGRNEPCPCGSSRKFKHCCGQS